MSSRVMVLETYGVDHLPGVWSTNGHGGFSSAVLSESTHYFHPPFPSPLLLVFQTQTPKLKSILQLGDEASDWRY